MRTISVSRFKMKHAVVSLLWILSIEVIQSSISNESTTAISQVGVTTTAAATNATAEDGRKSISSVISYSTMTLSPSMDMDVSTLSDSFVESTTSTPGLEATVLRMTSTADPSPSKTLTPTTTSATASERITSETIQPTQPVTSSKESNMTEKSTTATITPQNASSESKSVTPAMSHSATITTHNVTSVSVTTSSITKETAQNVTLVPTRESVTPVVSNETSKITATKFPITSPFVTSSQGATQTPSSNTSVTEVTSVTVTKSATAKLFSVTSTLFSNKSVTTSFSVSGTTFSPPVTKTTGITSSVTIATNVTTLSTVIATSTQPPTTTPSTTTKPPESPRFTHKPPGETSVEEGETLELTCKATGFPPPVIIWRKGTDNPLKNTSRIFISSDNSTLKILKTTRQDEGAYHCNASNGLGLGVAAETKVKIKYFSDLLISITEPVDQRSIEEGDTVKLTCSVNAYPRAFFEWMKDGKKFYGGRITQHSTGSRYVSELVLSNVTHEEGGNYSCLANTTMGSQGVVSKILYVKQRPRFTRKPPEKMSVEVGETLELTCKATGFPPPVIIWRKGTDNPLKNTSRIFISSDNSTLKILKTTRQDEGAYQCNASNQLGRGVAAETKVKINYFSDLLIRITKPVDQRSIKEGDTVKLTCSVNAYPRPFFEWMKDGKMFYGGRSTQHSTGSRYVSDLVLSNVTREEGGNYSCWAHTTTGSKGEVSKILYVKLSSINLPTYPPPKRMMTSDHTITIPIHKITYLGNGKKVSYIQVIVNQLKEQTLPKRKPSSFQPSELGPYSKNRTELYIAAVISLEDVNELGSNGLVLGDGKKYPAPTTARRRRSPHDGNEVYLNAPLLPETYYTAFQRMVHVSSGQYHESLGWMPATKTDSGPHEVESDSNLSTILWIVCGSLGLLIVVIVCMVVYVINRNKTREIDIDGPELRSEKNGGALGKMARSLSFHMARLHDHYHPSGPIPIENFADHVTRMHKSGDMHFSTEYERIPEYVNIPATHCIDPANQWKNRYSNIVAYDYNRVKLIPYDDEPASDYINASYITGYNNENTYIAAQGPLDETCGDFWRMVWEQNTRVIVMLTNVRERGRLKCSQYWPTSGKQRYEVIYVSLEDVIELTAYTIRVFRIAMSGQKETRVVKQFHFTGWPDHGVPKSATFLLAFVRQTANANPPDAGPMVVHCSAGVGRTGTFIVIDVMLRQIAKEKTVDILNYVTQLRKQRNLMVQTEQQYIFIHDALLDVIIIGGDTEIHASKLRKHVQEMSEPFKETGETKMTLEFRKLSRGMRPHTNFTAATIPANKSKNRYANTLPFDDSRVPLVVQTAVNGSDYINANYIDAYMRKRAFIATQAPLPDTFDDFWRMIWEQKCYTIVVLAQEVENAKMKMNRYWPTTHPITFGNLQVEMLEEEKKEFLETRVFNITNTTDSSSQIVHQFHYTAWTSEDLSDSGINLLNMIERIQQWQDASGNHAITVHCSAGVGRTGVFCAVSSLIERLKAEAVVDVFQTVKQLREQRPAMVQTKSQYEFCYRVLLEYLDTHTSLEEMDPFPVSPESSNTGNPPPSEEDQNEVSEQNSPQSAESNRKSDLVDSALTSDSLSEVKQKNSSNHNIPETVTSEHVEPGDVITDDKAQANVTAENNGLENVNVDVTLENGVSEENATPENVTQQNILTENIENGTLEGDVTLKDTGHEDVTQQKVSQDVMPETNQKTDEETLANNDVENSRAVLQRADSEESDPYVSPLSSSLNVNGS